jgi:hypothetical protein
LSKDKSIHDEHVTIQKCAHAKAEGDVTEHPAKAAKYSNMVLDNHSKSNDVPETSRKKVKRPRLTEGPKDPKSKTHAPATELVPVASSSTDVTMGTSVVIALVVITVLTILYLGGNE